MIDPLKIKGNASLATRALRLILLKECKGMCEICHKPLKKRFEVHHRDGCGLNWHRDNLIVLCVSCHRLVTGANSRYNELPLDWGKPSKLPFDEVRRQYIQTHPRA